MFQQISQRNLTVKPQIIHSDRRCILYKSRLPSLEKALIGIVHNWRHIFFSFDYSVVFLCTQAQLRSRNPLSLKDGTRFRKDTWVRNLKTSNTNS